MTERAEEIRQKMARTALVQRPGDRVPASDITEAVQRMEADCVALRAQVAEAQRDIAARDALSSRVPLSEDQHVHTFGAVQCHWCVERETRLAHAEAALARLTSAPAEGNG